MNNSISNQDSCSENGNLDVNLNEKERFYLSDSLSDTLSPYTYKGYCAGTYYSEWKGEERLIIFSNRSLEINVYPFCGCEPVVVGLFPRVNFVSEEMDEDIPLNELYEGKELRQLIDEYLSSECCVLGKDEDYEDNYDCKRMGANHLFYEGECIIVKPKGE